MLRNVLFLIMLSGAVASPQTPTSPPVATPPHPLQPATPLDWFRRADNLTNIRLPESPPFRIEVVFQAFPGYDFTKPGKSTIVTGAARMKKPGFRPKNGAAK
jgi:hypothetical protein